MLWNYAWTHLLPFVFQHGNADKTIIGQKKEKDNNIYLIKARRQSGRKEKTMKEEKKMAQKNKDIEDAKKIMEIFTNLSEESKTMAVVYTSALRDRELMEAGRGQQHST